MIQIGQPNTKATEYRRLATHCSELAELVTLPWDRERLLAQAKQWHELAQSEEAKTTNQLQPDGR
jgi:hypothetical protein